MNERRVQISFEDSKPLERVMEPAGVRLDEIMEFESNPTQARLIGGSTQVPGVRRGVFPVLVKSFLNHAHPVRWGINE